MYDLRIENISAATMTDTGAACGLIEDAAVLAAEGKIVWIGKRRDAPAGEAAETADGKGGLLTPGLIDCHTHLIYGGNRALEFEERLTGVSYSEILKKGGGILSTVRATREASEDELTEEAFRRLQTMRAEGMTTVEIKSGYGLNLETELKMLRVMHRLQERSGITVMKTFLGAHAVPAEYKGNSGGYTDFVCGEMLPAIAPLADFADVFCEHLAFTPAQTAKVFRAAKQHGLKIRIHAEQLSNTGAAALAARYGALSADHLEYLDEAGAEAMAEAGTAAVLLPGAFYFLGEKTTPPVSLLRKHSIPMAVSTDSNPGSSPCLSLLLMMNMACVLFRFTPEEALLGVTKNAAKALGMEDSIGTLEPGKQADMALFDVSSPAELSCSFGVNPCRRVWKAGICGCRTAAPPLKTDSSTIRGFG